MFQKFTLLIHFFKRSKISSSLLQEKSLIAYLTAPRGLEDPAILLIVPAIVLYIEVGYWDLN